MITGSTHPVFLTLAIGLLGATGAWFLGLPAAPLIGAAIATSSAAWSGVALKVDNHLRDIGFLIIGLSLGSGFELHALQQAGSWILSLLVLCISIFVTLSIGAWLLRSGPKLDRETAILASSPGTMSLALAIAADVRGDATKITVIQSMRLFLLTAILPLTLASMDLQGVEAGMKQRTGVLEFAWVVLAGWIASLAIKRTGFPAAFLVGGMVVSAFAQVFGLIQGTTPVSAIFLGYCIVGCVIGSRFSGISLQDLRREFGATLLTVSIAASVSMMFAAFVSSMSGIPFSQLWVAYAPGGVEAMAAIGFGMGFDPTFIALHHLVRISFLMICLPLILKR